MGDVIELALRIKDEASKALQGVAKEAASTDAKTSGLTQSALALNAGLLVVAGGATAAAAAMFAIAKSAGDLVDHFSQMSAQVGIDANTLIALDSVARQSGTTLDVMTFGLKSLTNKLADAAGGNEAAQATFAKLGVAVTDSHGKMRDAESVLRDVADALIGVDDKTQRAALAMEVFGARGAVVASALENGSAALDEWGAKARQAGLVIDTNAVAAAERWDASMEELRLTMAGLKQTVGEESIPAFVALAEALTPIAHAVSLLIGPLVALGEVIEAITVGPIKLLWSGLVKVTEGFTGLLDELNAVPGIVEEATSPIQDLGAAVASTSRIYEDSSIKGEQLADAFARMGSAAAANARKVKTLADALAEIGLGAADAAAARAELEGSQGGGAAFRAELFSATLEAPTLDVGMSADSAALASQRFSEALEQTMDAPAKSFASKASAFLASEGVGAAAGLVGGDVSGALAMAGPVGAAVGGVAAIGEMGAKGVREQLMGFERSLLKGLKALPKIIGDVLPDFIVAFIRDFIPALIEAGPKILKSLVLDLPMAIITALGDMLRSILPDFLTHEKGGGGGLFAQVQDFAVQTASSVSGSFARGTMSVDRTGLALIHRGEQVVQAGGRAKQGTGGGVFGGGVSLTINTLTLDPNGALRVVQLLEKFLNPASGRYRSSVLGTAPAAD